MQVLAAVRTHGVDACITRGANTYGPNQYPEKIVPLFVTNAFDGLELPVYGDGRQVREWLHASDHAAASTSSFARAGRARSTTSAARSARTSIVTQRIVELTGCDPALVRTSRTVPGTTAATRSTTRSSARSAGRRRARSTRASPETVEWYRQNRGWWEPIKSGEYREYYEEQYASRLAGG